MSSPRIHVVARICIRLVTSLVVVATIPWPGLAAGSTQPGGSDTSSGSKAHSCCAVKAADAADRPGTAYSRSTVSVEVPDVTLVDASGRSVSLRSLLDDAGGPVMLSFIFTSCTTICPVLSATFAQVDRELSHTDDDLRLVSITIDPEHDTADRLRAYADRLNADHRWSFLTGPRATIDTVQKAFGAYRGSKFNHAPLTFIHRPGAAGWVRLEGLGDADGLLTEYRRRGGAG